MPKPGRTASLVSAHGPVKIHSAGKLMHCRRCNADIQMGVSCIRVGDIKFQGQGKAYCMACFEAVLVQTEEDISHLRDSID